MNRRSFLTSAIVGGLGARDLTKIRAAKTEHVIFICCGGVRKRDYYENPSLCPNIRRLADDGFVFEQDHCEQVASHDAAFAELTDGLGDHIALNSIRDIPRVLASQKPRIIVCRESSFDCGHASVDRYLSAVKITDACVGRVFDWVQRDHGFSRNTAIVFRPEFGRDDEVNAYGQLHHSYGFYSTHRVASIFWGPGFNRGVDCETVITSRDLVPRLTRLLL